MQTDTPADSTERGQVGIGTLIVFIAMVLVAAIAAGVLINTAGFLQTQAEQTGVESTEQVADALNVITEVGEVGGEGEDNITEVRVGVQPAAGASDINLAELTIQYVSDDDFMNLVVAEDESRLNESVDDGLDPEDTLTAETRASGDSDPNDVNPQAWNNSGVEQRYGIDVVTAEQEQDIVMTENSDRYELVLNTSGKTYAELAAYDVEIDEVAQTDFEGPLREGSDVQLTITTEVGAQTVAFLQVPDSLVGEDAGDTINL